MAELESRMMLFSLATIDLAISIESKPSKMLKPVAFLGSFCSAVMS